MIPVFRSTFDLGARRKPGPLPIPLGSFLLILKLMNIACRHSLSVLFLASSLSVAACSSHEGSANAGDESGGAGPDSVTLLLRSVPAEARMLLGSGEPRTSPYWATWSTCGEGSRAETAAANGGREAGWILVDDLLEDPGISLGEWPVATCQDAVGVLEGDPSNPAALMARQLLSAELNLAAGAGTCAITRELVLAGHALLANQQYDGSPVDPEVQEDGAAESMSRVAALLALYNSGRLCQ